MLNTEFCMYYQVKPGQTLEKIAAHFFVSARLLAKTNALTAQPYTGQILTIPTARGNPYIVQEGDTKTLLCGSESAFFALNGTDVFYLGMPVRIPFP